MPELATGTQRWQISELFARFGYADMDQVRADAARILQLDHLADLRELTAADADELLDELRRALRSGDEQDAPIPDRCGRPLREYPQRVVRVGPWPACGRRAGHHGPCRSVESYRHKLDTDSERVRLRRSQRRLEVYL